MKQFIRTILSFVLALTMLAASAVGASARCQPVIRISDANHSANCTLAGEMLSFCRRFTNCCINELLSRIACCEGKIMIPTPSVQSPAEVVIPPTEAPASESETAVEPTEAPAEIPAETPTEAPTDTPADEATVIPDEDATDAPESDPDAEPTIEPASDAEEPESAYRLSEYELKVVDLINGIRRQNGLGELTIDAELSRVARIKSQDMHDKGYFDHNSPTYGTPFEMMRAFGIRYRTAGENIAYGYRTPQAVVDGWMNSDGHRANILNASFTRIGMGYVADGGYWTQMFIG